MTKNSLTTALNQVTDNHLSAALCVELPTNGTVPDWIQLIPVGEVVGRDGRKWNNPDPQAVITQTNAMGRDVPLDWEHATEHKAPKGEEAPAAAWFAEFKTEDGFIWGKLDWNERGRASVANREYRYISPVFDYTKKDFQVYRIKSAALTNQPNLYLTALNHQSNSEGNPMNEFEELMAQLRAALALGDNADVTAALNAIQKLQSDLQTANNRAATPSLDQFVPRADYDTAINRATAAEGKLQEQEKEALNAEIESAVNQAVKEGKITPATKEFYTTTCQAEGGLDQFKKFVDAAPVIATPSGLDTKQPNGASTALNAEEKQVAEMFGNSEEDLKKYASR